MAIGVDGPAPWQLLALKAIETVPGMNLEQEKNIAVAMARDSLTYAQAVAVFAPRAAVTVVTAKQASVTKIANSKGDRNPHYTELVR